MSCHLMRCECLCCVMSPDAMQSHGEELLPVVPCNVMECYDLKMPMVVRSGCAVRSSSVTMWWAQRSTLYYKVLLQYYSSSTPVLLQYYKVLQTTTPALLCATEC